MIEVEALTLRRGRRRVLDAMSFAVHPGAPVAFLGPNGAGKTTTLSILAGVLRPSGGRAQVAGCDIVRERRRAQTHIGYLPEGAANHAHLDDLTVLEMLARCGAARGLDARTRRARIEHVVARLELHEALTVELKRLSKGWRQRAWLAEVMLHDPAVLILDEPTDGLDPNQKATLCALLAELSATRTVLMSTHTLEEVEAICARAVVIARGRIVADSPVAELLGEDGRLTSAFVRLTADRNEQLRIDA
ncbi:MAG: ABC transporter ATP-binding protein [Gammaproteobacteria bacterium]